MFCEKDVLKNFTKFTGKHPCRSLFFSKVAWGLQFYWKETTIQVFFSELCEIFKSTLFYRTPPVAASEKTLEQLLSAIATSAFINSFEQTSIISFLTSIMIKTCSQWTKRRSRTYFNFHFCSLGVGLLPQWLWFTAMT